MKAYKVEVLLTFQVLV